MNSRGSLPNGSRTSASSIAPRGHVFFTPSAEMATQAGAAAGNSTGACSAFPRRRDPGVAHTAAEAEIDEVAGVGHGADGVVGLSRR